MTLMGHVGCFSQSCVVTVVTVTVGTCVITIQNYLRLQGRHASGENHDYLLFCWITWFQIKTFLETFDYRYMITSINFILIKEQPPLGFPCFYWRHVYGITWPSIPASGALLIEIIRPKPINDDLLRALGVQLDCFSVYDVLCWWKQLSWILSASLLNGSYMFVRIPLTFVY
jgi:hypothetical protein